MVKRFLHNIVKCKYRYIHNIQFNRGAVNKQTTRLTFSRSVESTMTFNNTWLVVVQTDTKPSVQSLWNRQSDHLVLYCPGLCFQLCSALDFYSQSQILHWDYSVYMKYQSYHSYDEPCCYIDWVELAAIHRDSLFLIRCLKKTIQTKQLVHNFKTSCQIS